MMSHELPRMAIGVLVAVAPLLAGCGQHNSDRATVSGNVSFDGQPVAEGQIVFEPKSIGKMAVAPIVNGSYAIPKELGLVGGDYLVRITASRPTGKKSAPSAYSADQSPSEVYEQYIPAKYNSGSQVVVSINSERYVEHDFTLNSQ